MSYFNNPDLPLNGYAFDGDNVERGLSELPTAKSLRLALEDLQLAQQNLMKAQNNVPHYTGQWSDSDYTRNEEQTLIVASNAFEAALVASVLAKA